MPSPVGSGRRRLALAAVTVSTAAVGWSCAGGTEADGPQPPPTSAASTTSTTPDLEAAPRFAWTSLVDVDLGAGWHLVDGEGDAPVVEVERDGEVVGIVELVAFPLDTLPTVSRRLAEDGERAALAAHAEGYLREFREDRRQGCGPDHQFTPEPVVERSFPDGVAVRYGFTGGVGSEQTERTIQWAGIRGDDLVIVSVAAYDEGSCIGTEGAELTTSELAELEPLLAPAAEANPLPTLENS